MTTCIHEWDEWKAGKFTGNHVLCTNEALPDSKYCADHGKSCASCWVIMFADPVFPEHHSCDDCNAPGERYPSDLELNRVAYELDCGISGVEPYTVAS